MNPESPECEAGAPHTQLWHLVGQVKHTVALVFVMYGWQYNTSGGAENGDMEWMITRKTKDRMWKPSDA